MFTQLLLIDIETIPQAQQFSSLSPEWQKLFSDKYTKTMPETLSIEENYRNRAGIWAEFGKIICISTAYFYENDQKQICLRIKSVSGDDEKELLTNFISLCNKFYSVHRQFQFGGHNIREFDIPYICRRLLINHVALPPYLQLHDKRPWDVKMFDTLSWWKFGDIKNYTSLNLLASALNIPSSKTTMDSSMVQDVYYVEKNLPKIVTYCEQDVIVTANIILRFFNRPILSEEQINNTIE
jgi:Predicted 3''-5'' exonuclease related to the exonuclease domain of PolB.